MSWLSIFKKGDILTQGDRDELQKIEASTDDLRKLSERIEREWCTSMERPTRLRELAEKLAQDPHDQEVFNRLTLTATMPSSLNSGWQHRDIVLGVLNEKIEERLQPSVDVVRRVYSRALGMAEAELKKVESREKREAETEGFTYSPSGRVQALQGRVLVLRNAIATKYKHEGAIQNPAPWQERLKEWL